MAEEARIQLKYDTAMAIRKNQQFQRSLATMTNVGGRMAGAFMGYFTMIAGPAGIGLVLRALGQLKTEMLMMEADLDAFYRRQAQRGQTAAQGLNAPWVADLQTVMPGRTKAQIYQWAATVAQNFKVRGGTAGAGTAAFGPLSAFGEGPVGDAALADVFTVTEGGPMEYGPAGAWMSTMYKQLSREDPTLKTRLGRQRGMAMMITAAQQSVFKTGEMGIASKIAIPMLMHGGSTLAESLVITGALGHGFAGEPSKAGMVIRRLYNLATGKASPEMLALAADIGLDLTDMTGNYMSRWLTKWFAWMNTGTGEERRKKMALMEEAGFQQRTRGGMLQVAGGYEAEKASIRAAMGKRTFPSIAADAARTRKEWVAQETGAIAGAEREAAAPPRPGGALEATRHLALLEGAGDKPGLVAGTEEFKEYRAAYVARMHKMDTQRYAGDPFETKQWEELASLDLIGDGVYEKLKAIHAITSDRANERRDERGMLRAPYVRVMNGCWDWMKRLGNAKHEARQRHSTSKFFTLATFAGTNQQAIDRYRAAIRGAMNFIRAIELGQDVETRRPSTAGWQKLGEPELIEGITIPEASKEAAREPYQFRTPSGEAVPYEGIPSESRERLPTPGPQTINMQINNYGGVPQGVNSFRRGGNWSNPEGLA